MEAIHLSSPWIELFGHHEEQPIRPSKNLSCTCIAYLEEAHHKDYSEFSQPIALFSPVVTPGFEIIE